jgi:hypothetical protein
MKNWLFNGRCRITECKWNGKIGCEIKKGRCWQSFKYDLYTERAHTIRDKKQDVILKLKMKGCINE